MDLSSLVTTTTGPVGPQGPAGPQGNPATDDQTSTASALSANNTLTIAISGGNTQVIDLSNLNQDITPLTFNSTTNSLTVGITDGASQTISLSNLGITSISRLGVATNTNGSYALTVEGDAFVNGDIYRSSTVTFTHPDYVFESYFDRISKANPSYTLPVYLK